MIFFKQFCIKIKNIKNMRVTTTELVELGDMIESKGLDMNLFELIRGETSGDYKFKESYYRFGVLRHKEQYICYVFSTSTGTKNPKHSIGDWEEVKRLFIWWIDGIAEEIKAEEKVNLQKNVKKVKEFPSLITKISPKFNKIYNQAYHAEQENLDEICGLGYRKSFEFLIKDYVIKGKSKEEIKSIRDMPIMSCIRNYVTDDRVKALAERVLWLGNDHAHYLVKWKNKTTEDLKALIDLSVDWIEAHENLLTLQKRMEKVEKTMPKK